MTTVTAERVCSVDGCEGKHRSKGYCKTHYYRQLKGRPLEPGLPLNQTAICSVSGCTNLYSAKGLCKSCYFRSPDVKARKNARRRKGSHIVTCTVCESEFQTNYQRPNNYCSKACYDKGQLNREKERQQDTGRSRCYAPSCDRAAIVKGLCDAHNQRLRKGLSLTPPLQKKTKGVGEWPNGYGYIIKNTPSGRKMKHRYIMEQHLGRDLLPHENVHHKNGIRDDNRIENLELWSKSQPSGQRVDDKVAWSIKFLSEYDYEVNGVHQARLAMV